VKYYGRLLGIAEEQLVQDVEDNNKVRKEATAAAITRARGVFTTKSPRGPVIAARRPIFEDMGRKRRLGRVGG